MQKMTLSKATPATPNMSSQDQQDEDDYIKKSVS